MARRKPGRTGKRSKSNGAFRITRATASSADSIKAAEDLALAAFSSGLKLAAVFGSIAAKTTSMALASIATGADKFSEMVRQEAIKSQKKNAARKPRKPSPRTANRSR